MSHRIQLQQKIARNENFRQEMAEASQKYKRLLQRALYSDLSDVSRLIIDAGKDEESQSLYFIFGEEQSRKTKKTDKMCLGLVKFLDERVSDSQETPFTLVYFNTCCDSYHNYSTFRSFYRSLPLKYFANLAKLIIVDASFTVKALDWFVSGTINKLLKSLTVYVDHLKQLKQHHIVLTTKKLSFFPDYISQEKARDISRLSFRESLHQKITQDTAVQKPLPKVKFRLEDYECNQIGVPIALHLLISFFLMRKQYLKEEGLFRKSVVKSDVDEGIQYIKQKYYDFLEQITNPHIVSNLITRFLADLQQPLIPYDIYNSLIHDNGQSMQVFYLKQQFSTLPRKNLMTLTYLLDFLLQQVIPQKEHNKMTTYNIAAVLAPCLLRSGKELSIEELVYSKKLVIILEVVLNKYEQVFGDKKERLRIQRESAKVQRDKFYTDNIEDQLGEEEGVCQNIKVGAGECVEQVEHPHQKPQESGSTPYRWSISVPTQHPDLQ